MEKNLGLEGRSVIVTGASSGIGRAAALRFALMGSCVVAADVDASGVESIVSDISDMDGKAVGVPGDLTDALVVERVVTTAVEAFGSLDVLVNNAGIMDRMSALADVTDAEWVQVLRVNLTAPFMLTRAALPHMLSQGRGVIVNTASEACLRGSAAGAAYTASKHGLAGLTKSVAVMYRGNGIRANAVAPGGTVSNIKVNVTEGAHGPSALSAYVHNIGRLADADEQAAVIVFLASDAASNINGAVLPVDNGWAAV
ncbi:SDR family NAD(P)-dependent oxidoreductase [Streptomyces sp. NPDC056069]|uniref:SDR family NAD(P)-dependent oxidoreductase n=1 Tax=Streptomyces sp. NPDC056069 TaxID=3345702 RepID=UPI0035E24F71